MEEQMKGLKEMLDGGLVTKETKVKGYINRLEKDIKKLEFKTDRLHEFFTNRAPIECDQTQFKLMKEQGELMDQLLVVMKQRLDYELKIHPQTENTVEEDDGQAELPFKE